MARLLSIAFLVAWHGAVCSAEKTNSSSMVKLYEGASQSLEWISGMMGNSEKVSRQPRTFKLALVHFGRTGSTSFSFALKELGYSPVHDDEVWGVTDLFEAFTSGRMSAGEWSAELGRRGFDASPPMAMHKYVEWAATAPDIKVIMLTREPKKWAQSYLVIQPFPSIYKSRPFSFFKMIRDLQGFIDETLLNVPTQGRPELFDDAPTLEAGFEAWTEFVKKTVPPERLFVFSVKQGWGPLCEFLGVPTPSVPFPHVNEAGVISFTVKAFTILTWIWPLVFASPLMLLWCFCHCCCRKQPGDLSKKRQ